MLSPLAGVWAVYPAAGHKRYIIVFNAPPGNAEVAMVRNMGGEIRYVYDIIPGIAASLPEAAAETLMKNPLVDYIDPDVEVVPLSQTTPWGIDRVRAPNVWHVTRGDALKVAVLDTGIDFTHPDLAVNYMGGHNFVGDNDPMDDNGHGTHVAGTIAALDNDIGVVGVSPSVHLYGLKVLPGTTSDIIAAIEWSVTNGMDIINMSLGYSSSSPITEAACNNAYNAGLLLVAAAGNSGNSGGGGDNILQPARYESVIAVAAIDEEELRAGFSSTGPAVELSAPGVGILSAALDSTLRGYASAGGTQYEANALMYSGYGSVTGSLVECDLEGNPVGDPPAGEWIALIDRGTYSFAEKVQNAMNQGAAAAIIANNDQNIPDDPGSFTLEDGYWVPTVSVSYNSGNSIRTETGSGTVIVEEWRYKYLNGTSMASPHVAGVAALLWKYNPALTNVELRQLLQNTARSLGTNTNHYGFGLVDAYAAVQATLPPFTAEITAVSLYLGDVLAGANTWPDVAAKNKPVTISAGGSWQVTAMADGDITDGGNPAVVLDISSLKMGGSYATVIPIPKAGQAAVIAQGLAGTDISPDVHTTLEVPWERDDLVGKEFSVIITYSVIPQ